MILTFSFPFQMADAQVFEIVYKNEEIADKILGNKQELVNWDKKRQGNREALRELRKSDDKKTWITVGSMLVQMKTPKAIEILEKGKSVEDSLEMVKTKLLHFRASRDRERDEPFESGATRTRQAAQGSGNGQNAKRLRSQTNESQ